MSSETTIADVPISRSDKVLYPQTQNAPAITKAGVARYYADLAETMLPHLRGRLISMQRFPDGIEGGGFYEKKVPGHFPDFVATVQVDTGDGPQHQVIIEDERTLVYLADQACLTPHTWLSTAEHLREPDQLIIDLDPSVEDLTAVRRATVAVGELLDELGLTSLVKTTGSRGYHVLVPLRPERDFDGVRQFARSLARVLVAREPDLLTIEARKDKRARRVLVDIQRNAHGQTAVPPYALRARPGAPVATPIRWDEVSRVTPDGHTIGSIKRRLAQVEDPWAGIGRNRQTLNKAEERLGRLAD